MKSMKKIILLLALLVLALSMAGCGLQGGEDAVEPDPDVPGIPHAVTGYIVVRGFEWGPGVNRVIIELDTEVDDVVMSDVLSMRTSHYDREVTDAYLADSLGNAVKTSSQYVAFDMVTNFDCTGSPFENNSTSELNEWADSYLVSAVFTVEKDGVYYEVSLDEDCIDNRLCPEVERFNDRGSYTGSYLNPETGEMNTLTLNYAVYEPDSLDSWEQNPLIIWLHALGEGGTDIEKAILGNEVSALTETEIQSYFTSGDQVGAYVMVVQCPTYWLDSGTGTYHLGDKASRYTEILMDTIQAYVDEHPDVDPDRIYLGGASNGGYMTLNMLINYPDYFAAGFPCCPAYSYYSYAKDYDGSYRTVQGSALKTDVVYFTDEDAEILANTPLWFVQAITDAVVPPADYALPIYRKLLLSGADNCWFSLYVDVVGTESSDTVYLGHWSWIYLLNNQVAYVQDPEQILASASGSEEIFFGPERPETFTNVMDMQNLLNGFEPSDTGGSILASDENGTYENFFQWLNAQVRE